jgi:hypothetical protein
MKTTMYLLRAVIIFQKAAESSLYGQKDILKENSVAPTVKS